jgi:hypothetical protein
MDFVAARIPAAAAKAFSAALLKQLEARRAWVQLRSFRAASFWPPEVEALQRPRKT